jgi:hypothetical protein
MALLWPGENKILLMNNREKTPGHQSLFTTGKRNVGGQGSSHALGEQSQNIGAPEPQLF